MVKVLPFWAHGGRSIGVTVGFCPHSKRVGHVRLIEASWPFTDRGTEGIAPGGRCRPRRGRSRT